MEVPELNLKECESVFVKDDFYENIQAPKFHDFCSDEDPVVDAEAYFRRLSGMSPRPSTMPFADQNAFKGTKEPTILKPPGLPKAPLSSMALNTDVTSSVPKASSAGLKKAKTAVPMLTTPLTKSQDKAPSKNKMYQRVSPVSNATLSFPACDGKGNESVQAQLPVKSSENSDPNGSSQARRNDITTSGPKSEEVGMITSTAGPGSLQSSVCMEDNAKVEVESQILPKSHNHVAKPSKRKSELVARRVIEPATDKLSDVKDRKRKPAPRNTEAGLTKMNEAKSRVLKLQRKSSSSSGCDTASVISAFGPPSSHNVRSSCGEPVRASSIKPPLDRRTPRRTSDNSRRRRASGGFNGRPARRALIAAPKSSSVQGRSGNSGVQLSLSSSMLFGSNSTNTHLSSTEQENPDAVGGPPKLSSVPAFLAPSSIVTSSWNLHALEVCRMEDEGCPNLRTDRASDAEELSGKRFTVQESLDTPASTQDTLPNSGEEEVRDSEADLLLQKLQNLQLQQEVSEAVQESETDNPLPPMSCVTGFQHPPVAAEVDNGPQTQCSKEHIGHLMPDDNANTSEAWVSTCPGLNGGDPGSHLGTSESTPKVVPIEGQEELDCLGSQERQFPEDVGVLSVCHATSVLEELSVAQIDPNDVIESFQNLQIKPISSEIPCLDVVGSPVTGNSSLAVGKKYIDDAGNCNDRLLESHYGVPPVDCEIAASSTQEMATGVKTRSLKRLISKGPSRETHCDLSKGTESGLCALRGPHFDMNYQRRNKRKSIELGPHRSEQRSSNKSTVHNADERKATVASQSSLAPLTHSQLSSSVLRSAVPSGISGQHKKMKATCPQPFRLRTEERGALKELEFNKKVELYMAAKEKMQSVPFPVTANKDSRVLNQNSTQPTRNPSKDCRTLVKQIHQHSGARAAERALFDLKVTEKSIRADEEKQEKEKRMQLEAEEEIRRMRKRMIPQAQRMPFFDRPFKPHRSTKTLTVPNSPKFHSLKAKKTLPCPTTQE